MKRAHCRGTRSRPRMPPRLYAEHVIGFVLGLAIAAVAINHGRSTALSPLPSPRTLTEFPGP